ncbi:hypothetical protein KJE20_07082 [Pyrenophora tritici-repentis]|uniref:Uncharacterized protein n=1 Tax=Pyrenophora tritici-repentis TaxID=45151 RepID=A0A922N9S4_9PLEO|nr:hypothetical protein Ptr86124_006579 [Pyrenophora tritici-repentis]KAI1682350.1 hypothetical protein KJE20_07082 [Pyrenophora tritici-repentis]
MVATVENTLDSMLTTRLLEVPPLKTTPLYELWCVSKCYLSDQKLMKISTRLGSAVWNSSQWKIPHITCRMDAIRTAKLVGDPFREATSPVPNQHMRMSILEDGQIRMFLQWSCVFTRVPYILSRRLSKEQQMRKTRASAP